MTLYRKRLIFGVILALGGLTITAMAVNFSPSDLKIKILRDIIAVAGLCNTVAGLALLIASRTKGVTLDRGATT